MYPSFTELSTEGSSLLVCHGGVRHKASCFGLCNPILTSRPLPSFRGSFYAGMFHAFLSALWPIVSSKRFKLLVISLFEKYAKTTDNTVDDAVVQSVKAALLPNRV